MWKNELRNKEFSTFCEYVVCSELQNLGWEVYQPLIDRYIDIIAIKKIGGKEVLRTIQVKGSRVENEETDLYESYGLTHEPKDLLHSPEHFFIWVLIDKFGKLKFIVIPISEFIKIRFDYIPQSTRRKHPSLLMRNEWRYGTDRMHPHFWKDHSKDSYKNRFRKCKNPFKIKNSSLEVEGSILDYFLNNWKILENPGEPCNIQAINAQEINEFWRGDSEEIMKEWEKNNLKAYSFLDQDGSIIESSKKLDEIGYPEK